MNFPDHYGHLWRPYFRCLHYVKLDGWQPENKPSQSQTTHYGWALAGTGQPMVTNAILDENAAV